MKVRSSTHTTATRCRGRLGASAVALEERFFCYPDFTSVVQEHTPTRVTEGRGHRRLPNHAHKKAYDHSTDGSRTRDTHAHTSPYVTLTCRLRGLGSPEHKKIACRFHRLLSHNSRARTYVRTSLSSVVSRALNSPQIAPAQLVRVLCDHHFHLSCQELSTFLQRMQFLCPSSFF